MTNNVQCCNCGYLAIRNNQTRQLMEVEIEIRKEWRFPELGGDQVYGMRPICFRMEQQFSDDLDDLSRGDIEDFKDITTSTRDCVSFADWKQGWTPREHMEMHYSEKMLEDQRAFQARESQLAEERHRTSLTIGLAGAALGAFATLVAGAIAIWPRH